MNRFKYDLLNLNVETLFIEHKIDEIVEIDQFLFAEIERKRNELRSMVGDRYKDILCASDSIKNMETILNNLVEGIQNMNKSCCKLLENDGNNQTAVLKQQESKLAERIYVVQVRLAIQLNDEIWMCLDNCDYLKAAQLYLLAQHVHTGLTCTEFKYSERVPLLKQIKQSLSTLSDLIHKRIVDKLESIELNSREASSNLSALLLLEHRNSNELVQILLENRRVALNSLVCSNYSSVRVQISEMVKCIVSTLQLLHDSFISCEIDERKGLVHVELELIQSKNTLSFVKSCGTRLEVYIPEIVRNFRPGVEIGLLENEKIEGLLKEWLESTKGSIGLDEALKVVTNMKGLNIIREEASKAEVLPFEYFQRLGLGDGFNVWGQFFQNSLTKRALELIRAKIQQNFAEFQGNLLEIFKDFNRYETELEFTDFDLSMSSQGFSKCIVELCGNLNGKFLELLKDFSCYSHNETTGKKSPDIEILNKALMEECLLGNSTLLEFIITKNEQQFTIFSIRLLDGILKLCDNLKKCTSLNNSTEIWYKICENFQQVSTKFWNSWIEYHSVETRRKCAGIFENFTLKTCLEMFHKWDCIEICEQTEDEKIFKSNIKIPARINPKLVEMLEELNAQICAVKPHTIPKKIHASFIEKNIEIILENYEFLTCSETLNQNFSMQLLFDVKFLCVFCITRDNSRVQIRAQAICDKLRSKIDPFDLDVFYEFLQANVRRAALQNQLLFGCLLPSSMQLSNLETSERKPEVEPSILNINCHITNEWFPLLPITAPSTQSGNYQQLKNDVKKISKTQAGKSEGGGSSASSLFGNLTSDWF